MTDGPSQALNLGGRPDPYGDIFVPLDLMKGTDTWHYTSATGEAEVPLGLLARDLRGWVTDLPVIGGEVENIYTNVFYGHILPATKFILEWQGEGTVEIYQNYTVIGPNKILIDFVPDYTDANGNLQDDGITVLLTSIDPENTGNHIRNIKLYALEDTDLIAAGERFNPDWFERVDDFRVLRTHDWQSTNFPTTVEWSRNVETADQADWGQFGRGMPYELLVGMANETRSDLWINIPHTASDDYMRAAAAYLKANLDPGLRLLVEFSNEYWTTIFDQYGYFTAGGAREFGGDAFAAGQFYGTEAARMADIFAAEFGADSATLRPVLTVDNVMFLNGEAEAMLTAPSNGGDAPVSHDFDVIATDGYLTWYAPNPDTAAMIRDWMTDADGGFGRARDFLLDQLENDLLPSWQAGRALADQYGLEFMVYEGGALLLNMGDNPAADLTDFAIRFTRSPEMRAVYEAELAAWATVGTGAFAWYNDVGRPGPWGDYGHWSGPGFDPQPRTDAITDANQTTAPWWTGDDRPASTFENGRYDAGTGGRDALYGTALADRLYGLAGDDVLKGGTGADRLWGGNGADALTGGAGADTLNGGDGGDVLNGGGGFDCAEYRQSTAGVSVNLTTGQGRGGAAAGDILIAVEALYGSDFADRLTGDAAANALWGEAGADTIAGGAGNDSLQGGDGDDKITGGHGADRLSGGQGNDAFIYQSPNSGGDTITDFATSGDDRFALAAAAFGHATGGLVSGAFQSSTAATAQTAAARIIHDSDTGRIWFDADGAGGGAAVLLATVQPGATITAADFGFF